jgi:uncharacterized membrane protein (DUF2068 family)
MAIAIYRLFICVISLGNAFQDFRSAGINSGYFWIDLIYGLGFAVIAWGLLRLKEWARFLAMLTIALWAGERLPLYLFNTRHFDFSYSLIVAEELIDLFAIWYLFRLPTAKYFSKLEKAA